MIRAYVSVKSRENGASDYSGSMTIYTRDRAALERIVATIYRDAVHGGVYISAENVTDEYRGDAAAWLTKS